MKHLLLTTLFFFAAIAQAKTINVSAIFDISIEGVEIDQDFVQKAGWQVTEDDDGETLYQLNVQIEEEDLPYKIDLSDAYLMINRKAVLSFGILAGDLDGTSELEFQLPVDNSNQLKTLEKINLRLKGGEHATSAWRIDSRVSVSVTP